MTCLDCGRGFHDECEQQPCCCNEDESNTERTIQPGGSSNEVESDREEPSQGSKVRNRNDSTSPQQRKNVSVSAGRKRAAVEYEIDPGAPCEWRGKVNCGGGFYPVPGCLLGFQTDRHHGPDKTTTNNSSDNIHLICKPCHNLWHRRNDPAYGPTEKCPEGIKPHEPKWATEDEFLVLAARTKDDAA